MDEEKRSALIDRIRKEVQAEPTISQVVHVEGGALVVYCVDKLVLRVHRIRYVPEAGEEIRGFDVITKIIPKWDTLPAPTEEAE